MGRRLRFAFSSDAEVAQDGKDNSFILLSILLVTVKTLTAQTCTIIYSSTNTMGNASRRASQRGKGRVCGGLMTVKVSSGEKMLQSHLHPSNRPGVSTLPHHVSTNIPPLQSNRQVQSLKLTFLAQPRPVLHQCHE